MARSRSALPVLALSLVLLLTACGGGDITEEEYQEVMRALEEARAVGDPEAAVYEEFGVTPEELRDFETERSDEELAELRGLDTELGGVPDEAADQAMNEEDYVEVFVFIGGLQSMGLTPEEVDSRMQNKLDEMGYTTTDLQDFSDYVQNTPEIKERVDAAIEERIASGEQIMIVEEPLEQE